MLKTPIIFTNMMSILATGLKVIRHHWAQFKNAELSLVNIKLSLKPTNWRLTSDMTLDTEI